MKPISALASLRRTPWKASLHKIAVCRCCRRLDAWAAAQSKVVPNVEAQARYWRTASRGALRSNSPARCRHRVASVSNWGGYGLVAALSRLAGRNLLPSVEHETQLIRRMVEIGLVDGTTGNAEPTVDDFSTEENGAALEQLHRAVG